MRVKRNKPVCASKTQRKSPEIFVNVPWINQKGSGEGGGGMLVIYSLWLVSETFREKLSKKKIPRINLWHMFVQCWNLSQLLRLLKRLT